MLLRNSQKRKVRMKSKRGQVSVFIIIGVVIVAGVVFYFLLAGKKAPVISKPVLTDPEILIEKCAEDAAVEAIEIMLPQGGYLNPENYKLYNNTKVQYLCYTTLFYQTCINQEPLYIKHLQDEITGYITPKIEDCFSDLKSNLEQEGYTVKVADMKVSTALSKGSVKISIDRDFRMNKQETAKIIEKFESVFNSPVYKMGILAQEIANEEAKYCYFEYVGYMLLYPDMSISKKHVGQGSSAGKIYTITDKDSKKVLNMAVRSCEVPAGF